jgi:hypothetical protein
MCDCACMYLYYRATCVCSVLSPCYYVVTQMATLYSKLCHLKFKYLTYFTVLTEKGQSVIENGEVKAEYM